MIIRELSPRGGADIAGVDLSSPLPSDERSGLAAAFEQYGLLVMRDQSLAKRQLVAATEPFGGPELHPAVDDTDAEAPGVSEIRTRGPDGEAVHDDDEALLGDIDWHTDQAYITTPNRGKLLYAVEIPERGGMTGFVDGFRTYAALPDATKQRIEGLHVVQSWAHAQATIARNRGFRREGDVILADNRFPDVEYPVVVTHPVSGRKSLNITPLWSTRIAELPAEESRELLAELTAHLSRPEFAYWHRYRPGDLVAWDNWRFLHAASGTPGRYARVVWSVVIRGGPQLGRIREDRSAEPVD